MICIIGLAYLTLGFSAAGLGYILLKAKGAAPAYVPPKPVVGWGIQYSPNMPTTMTLGSDGGYFFDFPNVDGVHYVVENISGLRQGQFVNMRFSVTGDGAVIGVQGGYTGEGYAIHATCGRQPIRRRNLSTISLLGWRAQHVIDCRRLYNIGAVECGSMGRCIRRIGQSISKWICRLRNERKPNRLYVR